MASQTAAKGVATIVYQPLPVENGGSFGGVGAVRQCNQSRRSNVVSAHQSQIMKRGHLALYQ